MPSDRFSDAMPVHVTHAAKSKAFRLYREHELQRLVRELDGEVYTPKHADEFHLKTPKGLIVVFTAVTNGVLVVTQKHDHNNVHQTHWKVDKDEVVTAVRDEVLDDVIDSLDADDQAGGVDA